MSEPSSRLFEMKERLQLREGIYNVFVHRTFDRDMQVDFLNELVGKAVVEPLKTKYVRDHMLKDTERMQLFFATGLFSNQTKLTDDSLILNFKPTPSAKRIPSSQGEEAEARAKEGDAKSSRLADGLALASAKRAKVMFDIMQIPAELDETTFTVKINRDVFEAKCRSIAQKVADLDKEIVPGMDVDADRQPPHIRLKSQPLSTGGVPVKFVELTKPGEILVDGKPAGSNETGEGDDSPLIKTTRHRLGTFAGHKAAAKGTFSEKFLEEGAKERGEGEGRGARQP